MASDHADPVITLWRDWFAARRVGAEACSRRQKLEADLLRQFGSAPRTKVVIAEDIGFMWAYDAATIDRLLPDPEQAETRLAAHADLTARLAAWAAVDERIGFSKAKAADAESSDLEEALAEELWATSPGSVAGVAAKLHSLLETEDPNSCMQQEPWPQLRSVLADLVRIAETVP